MGTLFTLGVVGVMAYAVHVMIARSAGKTPDGISRVFGFGTRPTLGVLGLIGAVLFSGGFVGLLSAAVAAGALVPQMIASRKSAPQLTAAQKAFGEPEPTAPAKGGLLKTWTDMAMGIINPKPE